MLRYITLVGIFPYYTIVINYLSRSVRGFKQECANKIYLKSLRGRISFPTIEIRFGRVTPTILITQLLNDLKKNVHLFEMEFYVGMCKPNNLLWWCSRKICKRTISSRDTTATTVQSILTHCAAFKVLLVNVLKDSPTPRHNGKNTQPSVVVDPSINQHHSNRLPPPKEKRYPRPPALQEIIKIVY